MTELFSVSSVGCGHRCHGEEWFELIDTNERKSSEIVSAADLPDRCGASKKKLALRVAARAMLCRSLVEMLRFPLCRHRELSIWSLFRTLILSNGSVRPLFAAGFLSSHCCNRKFLSLCTFSLWERALSFIVILVRVHSFPSCASQYSTCSKGATSHSFVSFYGLRDLSNTGPCFCFLRYGSFAAVSCQVLTVQICTYGSFHTSG